MALVLLFKLKIMSILHFLTKNFIYTSRQGITKGLRRKGGLGFFPQMVRQTQEENFLMTLDFEGQTIYDVGGGHGHFSAFFAQAVGKKGKVIVFEPNPDLCKQIMEIVNLNKFDNVEVLELALGKERNQTTLVFPLLMPGVGSVDDHVKIHLCQSRSSRTVLVEVDSLDHQIKSRNLPKPSFIKIDVQGSDLSVLVGMSKTIEEHKPRLLVEVHSGYYEDWKLRILLKVVQFLSTKGYAIYHIESDQMITSRNSQIVEVGEHLYCA